MLFLVLVTSTKHYWIISAERRRNPSPQGPETLTKRRQAPKNLSIDLVRVVLFEPSWRENQRLDSRYALSFPWGKAEGRNPEMFAKLLDHIGKDFLEQNRVLDVV